MEIRNDIQAGMRDALWADATPLSEARRLRSEARWLAQAKECAAYWHAHGTPRPLHLATKTPNDVLLDAIFGVKA